MRRRIVPVAIIAVLLGLLAMPQIAHVRRSWSIVEAKYLSDNPLIGHWGRRAVTDTSEYFLSDRHCVESWGRITGCLPVRYRVDGQSVTVVYTADGSIRNYVVGWGSMRAQADIEAGHDVALTTWTWAGSAEFLETQCRADPDACPITEDEG